MTMGRRKNLAIFAKHMAFINRMAGFGADLKNGDFRRLKFNRPINTKLSENSKKNFFFSILNGKNETFEGFFFIYQPRPIQNKDKTFSPVSSVLD